MKHKYALLLIIFALAATSASPCISNLSLTHKEHNLQSSDYTDGWNQGYKDGWCYGKGIGCYPAYPPYPPYPRYGEDTYKGGYNRGFLQALSDRDK